MSTIAELTAVIELLTRKFNPPHAPPRAAAAPGVDLVSVFAPMASLPLRGIHLRGLPDTVLGRDSGKARWHWDTRGSARSVPIGIALAPPATAMWHGHGHRIDSLVLSSDGRLAVSASWDRTLRVWALNPDRGASEISRLQLEKGWMDVLAISSDGTRLAGGGFEVLHLWMLDAEGNLRETSQHKHIERRSVTDLAFGPDGRTLATAGGDGSIRLWTVESDGTLGSVPVSVAAHDGTVQCLAFDPKQPVLASADGQGWLKLWAVEANGRLREMARAQATEYGSPIASLAFGPDGKRLASAGLDGSVRQWLVDGESGLRGCPRLDLGSARGVRDLAFCADGAALAGAGNDGLIRLWTFGADEALRETAALTGHRGEVRCVACGADGITLVSAGDDASIRFWVRDADESAHAVAQPVVHGGPVYSVAFGADGQTFVSAGEDGAVHAWAIDREGGVRENQILQAHERAVFDLAISADGRTLATAAYESSVRLYSIGEKGSVRSSHLIDLDAVSVRSVAFSALGNLLATASSPRGVGSWKESRTDLKLWDLLAPGTARVAAELPGFQGDVRCIALRGDGKALAIADERARTVGLWTPDRSSAPVEIAHFGEDAALVNSLAFTPDGERLAGALRDGSIIVWTLDAQGGVVGTPERQKEHAGPVLSIVFDRQGKVLASAGADRTIRLWEFASDGRLHPRTTLRAHEHWIRYVAFSSDGQSLLSASDDGSIRLWSQQRDGTWLPASHLIGRGLDVLEDGTRWRLRRTDGQPFVSQPDGRGQRQLADPVAYPWLWFSGRSKTGDWVCVPAIDVPPNWIEWAPDSRTIWVERGPRVALAPVEPELGTHA